MTDDTQTLPSPALSADEPQAPAPREITFGDPTQLRPPGSAAPGNDGSKAITFGTPVQLRPAQTPDRGITFGEPVQLTPRPITFGEPHKAVSFDAPVDIFSEDAPIGLFEKWKASQPDVSLGDKIGDATSHVLHGASEAVKTIFDRTTSSARALLDPGLNVDDKFDRLVTQNAALGSEVAAEAGKGFAAVGSYLTSKGAKLNEALGPVLDDPSSPGYAARHEFARVEALKAERKFFRDSRDLSASANDGRVIANAIFSKVTGDQSNDLANAPVNEEGARFLANFVDPELGGQVLLKTGIRGLITKEAAETAVRQLPYSGELSAMERAATEARAKVFLSETEVLAAKSAGADASALEKSLAKDKSAFEEANAAFRRKTEYLQDQATALQIAQDQGKGVIQKTVGAIAQAAGEAGRGVGEMLTGVNESLDGVLSKFSAGSKAGEAVVGKVADAVVPGNKLRYSLADVVKSVGGQVAEAGKLLAAPESSLPYFQRLAAALPEDSIGRWTASMMESTPFLSSTGRWIFDSAESSAKGAGVGAAFGTLNGDPVGGAVQGSLFGLAGSQFGQFKSFNSPEQAFMRQQVDIELSRKRAEQRGPDALKAFDKMGQGSKLLVASLEAAHPDVFVSTNGEGVSWYDHNGAVGEISIDSSSPLEGVLVHEIKHHLSRNPEIGRAIETKLLGDPDTGAVGIFTARDAEGKPIVITTPDANVPGVVRHEFELTPEFYDYKHQYLQRLRDKNISTAGYENDNKRIAQEIFSESETGNILSRQPNGEFSVLAAQRMGSVQRKVADLVSGSDLVSNSAFLQRSLAKLGIVFDAVSGRAANTGLFRESVGIPGMEKLLNEFYRKSAAERNVSGDPEAFGERQYTEAEILKSPDLAEQFVNGFDTVRDPVSGKVTFVPAAEAKRRGHDFVEALKSELKQYAGNEAGTVKEKEAVNESGVKSLEWTGTNIPESVIANMEATGRFTPEQLATLRTFSKVLGDGRGSEVNFQYQPASKRGNRVYQTRPITERTETPMSLRITKDGNLLTTTISQEKLARNLVNLFKQKRPNPWNSDFQAAWGDVQRYLANHAEGLAGDANGLGTAKRDAINALFGQLTLAQRDANPLLQDLTNKKARDLGIVQSRRLDRLSKPIVLSSTFKPDYARVSKNYSPGPRPLPHSLGAGELDFTHYSDQQGLRELDPKFFGRSGITPRSERAGLPRSYAYAEGSKLGQDKGLVDVRGNKYEGTIAKGKLYDAVTDPLHTASIVNREKRDQTLIDRGYIGIYNEGAKGVKQLEFFKKVPLKADAGKQFSPGPNYDPVIVGDVSSDGIRMKKGVGLDHEKQGFDAGFGGDGHGWRYNPKFKELYWWNEKPNQQTQDLVAAHLESKGYDVKKQTMIDGQNAATDRAHGVRPDSTAPAVSADADAEFFRQFPEAVINRDGKRITKENFKQLSVTPDNTAAKSKTKELRGVIRPALSETDKQYSPGGNDETRSIAEDYVRRAGLPLNPHTGYDDLPEPKLRAIADYFEKEAKHDPENPEVKKSYAALATETKAQYDAMVKAGIKIEPFTGKGEPYKSSLEMMKDVRDNKHLSFFLTDSGFGTGNAASDNPLLKPSGVKIDGRELLVNDLFRAVHDFFGHTQQGFQFGPRGEFNAWKEHSRMFSDEAQGALAAETLAQNAWVNFGPHLRDPEGVIPKKGELGYVAPQDRPFAEQKTFVVPEGMRQFSPGAEKADEPLRISTRVPTAKASTENPLDSDSVSTVPLLNGSEKLDLGERPTTIEIGRALADRSRRIKRIPYDSRTEGAKEAAATAFADEIEHAVKRDNSAVGWYERKINEAMTTLAQVHPELADDQNRASFFKAVLAITSNGQAVVDNFKRADELYRGWKETGRLETDSQWGGARSAQINGSLDTLQEMVDTLGLDGTRELLSRKFRFGDIKKLAKEKMGIDLGSSESADHQVWGSIIFGPKVGGGFFPNLNGDFSPVTMDLWLMRTWNRINGTLGQKDPEGMGRAIGKLRQVAAENPGNADSQTISSLSDRALGNWAEARFAEWKNVRKFKDPTPFDRPAKNFAEAKEGDQAAPRNGNERAWVRQLFAATDQKLNERGLPPINNADKQALLWYYEKDLYSSLGYTNSKGQPADYADAAKLVLENAKR